MNITLLNGTHILHQDASKGPVTVMCVPLISKTKRFSDIQSPSDSTVKERYGDIDDAPALWRLDGPYVDVYGNIPLILKEQRNAVSAYLPQDFVGDDCGAFYFVINDRWIAHGVHTVTDDGKSKWGVSLLDAKADGIVDTIVSAISERILEGGNEKICVAVHKNEDIFLQLKDVLNGFGVDVKKMSEFMPRRRIKPLYQHRDFSLVMVTLAIAMFLMMLGAVVAWMLKGIELDNMEESIKKTQERIRDMQNNTKLGHITDPYAVLDFMKSDIPQPPSSLIHSGGLIARLFGDLKMVEIGQEDSGYRGYGYRRVNKDTYTIKAQSENVRSSFLVDQEKVGQSAIANRPWLRSLQRVTSADKTVELDIEVQVK